MDANRLKSMYERMPRAAKRALAPVFVSTMVDNRVFRETTRRIRAFEAMGADQRLEEQTRLLRETLEYAYANVPYYRREFDEAGFDPGALADPSDLERLPLLEKPDAVAAGEDLHSREEGLRFYETFTGGSSGQALRVLLDRDSVYKERAYVCHFLAKRGYDPRRTRTVAFWGHNKPGGCYYSPMKNEIVISPFRLFDDGEFDGVCRDIERFGARFAAGYPSAISLLAKKLKARGRSMRFDHVVYYAENHSDEDEALAREVFSCPVSSYYGHTERAVFAEIEGGRCSFSGSYGLTELVPTEVAGEYRIVCTGFLSRKMPLIRYATDDVAVARPDGGYALVGHKRSDVYLLAKNGERVFKGAMTLHLDVMEKVRAYQYVQGRGGGSSSTSSRTSPSRRRTCGGSRPTSRGARRGCLMSASRSSTRSSSVPAASTSGPYGRRAADAGLRPGSGVPRWA